MGRSGSAAAQYSAYGARSSGKFSSGQGMGEIYRRNYSGGQCTGQTDCIYAVGKTGAEKDPDADQSKTSDFEGGTSKSTVGKQWIFRMQTF